MSVQAVDVEELVLPTQNVCVCPCVCARGYYLMSILALSTHYGAGALIYPAFHALASSEGQADLAGNALESGPELESSRESRADPADTSFPARPILPMTQSPGQDRVGMENGRELTWAGVSSQTQKTFWVL